MAFRREGGLARRRSLEFTNNVNTSKAMTAFRYRFADTQPRIVLLPHQTLLFIQDSVAAVRHHFSLKVPSTILPYCQTNIALRNISGKATKNRYKLKLEHPSRLFWPDLLQLLSNNARIRYQLTL